jgi:hypothetical protein
MLAPNREEPMPSRLACLILALVLPGTKQDDLAFATLQGERE